MLATFTGSELVGKKYSPLFPYFIGEYGGRAFRVVSDTYVTDDAGTGVVHQVRRAAVWGRERVWFGALLESYALMLARPFSAVPLPSLIPHAGARLW